MGLAAAVLLWRDQWLAGAAMIQLFGVFSCVDGEVARLRGEASRLGDFLDTLTDRVTEASIVVALTVSLAVKLGPDRAWPAGIALLSGVMLLALSSEKFRSTYRMSYPKRRLESVFAVLSAGSDARLLVLTLAVVIGQIGAEAVCVGLRNNGPPLGPEERERIFEAFYTTKTRGTGLGMTICRRIVEAHGGQMDLGGTTSNAEFLLTLPRTLGHLTTE